MQRSRVWSSSVFVVLVLVGATVVTAGASPGAQLGDVNAAPAPQGCNWDGD
jgi:hypothetical protein